MSGAEAKIAVHMIFVKNGEVLLSKRKNTGYGDGLWSLPAGHLEVGETVYSCAIRESKEELGAAVMNYNIEFGMIMHRSVQHNDNRIIKDHERTDYFVLINWGGDVTNMEPEKCEMLEWFDIEELPDDLVAYIGFGIATTYYNEYNFVELIEYSPIVINVGLVR